MTKQNSRETSQLLQYINEQMRLANFDTSRIDWPLIAKHFEPKDSNTEILRIGRCASCHYSQLDEDGDDYCLKLELYAGDDYGCTEYEEMTGHCGVCSRSCKHFMATVELRPEATVDPSLDSGNCRISENYLCSPGALCNAHEPIESEVLDV